GFAHLHVMDSNGNADRVVTSSETMDDHPSWSPDGRALVYNASQSPQPTLGIVERTDAGGWSEPRRIPLYDASRKSMVGHSPRWSADGRWIAFVTDSPSVAVYLVSPSGARVSSPRRVVGEAELGFRPLSVTWSVTPNVVYVDTRRPSGTGLFAGHD